MCVLSDSCKTDSPNLKEKLCKQKNQFPPIQANESQGLDWKTAVFTFASTTWDLPT